MEVHRLTFNDIMERNLLYYDSGKKQSCELFCKGLQIDYLPSYDGRFRYFYNSKRDAFEKQSISQDQRISVHTSIFHWSNIDKFRLYPHQVLFVYEGEVLVGVVHVCDYNRDIVLEVLQKDILRFEQLLRKYLVLEGKTNEDVCMAKDKKADNFSPFQTFFLPALMNFTTNSEVSVVFSDEEKSTIRELRNTAMHGKDNITNSSLYYNTDDLEKLFKAIETLQKAYQKVLAQVHMKMRPLIETMNRKRLFVFR